MELLPLKVDDFISELSCFQVWGLVDEVIDQADSFGKAVVKTNSRSQQVNKVNKDQKAMVFSLWEMLLLFLCNQQRLKSPSGNLSPRSPIAGWGLLRAVTFGELICVHWGPMTLDGSGHLAVKESFVIVKGLE